MSLLLPSPAQARADRESRDWALREVTLDRMNNHVHAAFCKAPSDHMNIPLWRLVRQPGWDYLIPEIFTRDQETMRTVAWQLMEGLQAVGWRVRVTVHRGRWPFKPYLAIRPWSMK